MLWVNFQIKKILVCESLQRRSDFLLHLKPQSGFSEQRITLISGQVVLGNDQIFVLPELPAKVNNQIFKNDKLKLLDKSNQLTNFIANWRERVIVS